MSQQKPDSKVVKVAMDGIGLAAVITGIGWVGKKSLNKNFVYQIPAQA